MAAPNEVPPPPPGLPGAATAAAPAQPAAGGPGIDAIIKRMLAHLPVAFVVLVIGVSITMVMSRSRKPTYSSETVIYYREGISRVYVGVDGEGDQLKALPARLKETLLSRAHLEKVIKEFNLYPQIVLAEGYIAAVDKFRTKITFKPRTAETFLISYEGASAEEAQQVTARLADVLIEDMNERKKAQAKTTTDFLEGEKKRADDLLAKCDNDLARFIAQHPEFATENNAEQAGSGVRAEKVKATADPTVMALERQQQRLRAAVAAKDAPAAGGGAPAAGGGAAPAAPGPDPVLANQKAAADAELIAAQKDLADKADKLTDAHPDVKAAKARLAAAQAKARDTAMALAAATPAAPAAPTPVAATAPQGPKDDDVYDGPKAPDQKAVLARELASNARDLQLARQGAKPGAAVGSGDLASRIIALETEWKRMNREREKARQGQGDVDERLFRARSNQAIEDAGFNSQVRVLDEAFYPTTASGMAKGKFIIIGIAVSLVLGLVLAAVWGMMLDDRVFVSEDLVAFAPLLASVPKPPQPKSAAKKS